MRHISKILMVAAFIASTVAAARAEDAPKFVSGTYEADPYHSAIMFITNHLGLSTFIARFDDYATELKLDADDISKSSLKVTVKPASVDIDYPAFATEMMKPEWFDTAKYPEVTFQSTKFEQETPTTGKVTGNLTIKGVTRPLTLNVKLVGVGVNTLVQKEAIGIEATGVVKRSDFGLEEYIPLIPDNVRLHINAEFHKQD